MVLKAIVVKIGGGRIESSVFNNGVLRIIESCFLGV